MFLCGVFRIRRTASGATRARKAREEERKARERAREGGCWWKRGANQTAKEGKWREIKSKTKRLDLEFQGETFWVEYKPNALTVKSKSNGIVEQAALYISDWELLDEKGKHIEITEKYLQNIPIEFLRFVLKSIADDMKPNEDEKKS